MMHMHLPYPHISIIIPCYNESEAIIPFLQLLEQTLDGLPYRFCLVVVNDGSTDNTQQLLSTFQVSSGKVTLYMVSLEYNTGHQAAIYQGFMYATLQSDHFLVMDADGQDVPSVIPALLRHRHADIVSVVRSKRSESLFFKTGYRVYKLLFRVLTGKQMNFGNFCLISRSVLDRAIDEKFGHLAAFHSRQQVNVQYITADRETRIGGQSKMDLKKLLRHALHSFAAYREEIRKRCLMGLILTGILFAARGVLYITANLERTNTLLMLAICTGMVVAAALLLLTQRKRKENSLSEPISSQQSIPAA